MLPSRERANDGFKAKVALEAIRSEATIAELVSKHGVHQTLINAWKRQAIEGMAGVFSGKADKRLVHGGQHAAIIVCNDNFGGGRRQLR